MAQDDSVVVISSSPDFPSIHQLLAKSKSPRSPKRASLRSGKNAAPIPSDAPSTFTTAASLWKALHPGKAFSEDDTLDTNAEDDMVSKPDETKRLVESDVKATESAEKKPRKKRATTKKGKTVELQETERPSVDLAIAEDSLVPRRGRPKAASKTKDDGQTTIPKGRVTKAAPKEKKTRKKAETISKHFANPAPPTNPVTSVSDDEPIVMEQAMRRRLDWTPPPKESPINLEDSVLSQGPGDKDAFKNLLDGYSHQMGHDQASAIADSGNGSNDILGKRKLIQLVATPTSKNATPETSPTKSKASKKKPRTITELATAAYRTAEESEVSISRETARKESVLDYFDTEDPHAENSIDTAKPAKTAKKASKARASRKKAEPKKQILLSPASALKLVSGQDFVFGTASQLATEDDPDLLRALHEAMKASNCPDSDPFASSSPVRSDLASRMKVGNKLWTVGARDDEGDLLDIEPLDLTQSPVPNPDPSLPELPVAQTNNTVQDQVPTAHIPIEVLSSEFDTFDLTESPAVPSASKSLFVSTQATAPATNKKPGSKLPPPPVPRESIEANLATDLDFEPPPSNQEHSQLIAQSQAQASPAKPQASMPQRPNFELYTDARLAKEISGYGFKPVKKRATMIALLEKCWENKQKTALPNTVTDDAVSITQTISRKKGRPRKVALASPDPGESPSVPPASTPKRARPAPAPEAIVEIADSEASSDEDPFISSPVSAEGKEDVFSDDMQEPMDTSLSEDPEDASLLAMEGPTTQQALLFNRITRAVTTAPRTTDPENPSWYEKMLMYDPVILEDLTAWLNSGQLDRVGYDGEVDPEEVKLWCLSKSVCCLWRVNMHGKARKRF